MMVLAFVTELLQWMWISAYAVIGIIHVSHIVRIKGQQRAWHFGHIAMCLGMAYMFLPVSIKTIPAVLWILVFTAITVLISGQILRTWIRGQKVNSLWVLTLIDMSAMIYMFVLPKMSFAPLTYVLVAYFTGEMIVWLVGAFDSEYDPLIPLTIGPQPCSECASTKPLVEASSIKIRMSICTMTVGMIYMFVAMHISI